MTLVGKARVFAQMQHGLLFQYGWLKSWWQSKPVDANGHPLPWLTYPAIDSIPVRFCGCACIRLGQWLLDTPVVRSMCADHNRRIERSLLQLHSAPDAAFG